MNTTSLNAARTAFIGQEVKKYGALRTYSEALTEKFGEGWWLIPMAGPLVGNEKALREDIREEKKALQALAEERKLSNPWKPWSDVLKYVKGETKKGAKSNAPRDMFDRFKTELTKLYKAGLSDEEPTSDLLEANRHVGAALIALGVDVTEFNIQK